MLIDLSAPIQNGMAVFPGDPKVSIKIVQNIEKDEWEMRQMTICTHVGTHVNFPSHCVSGGKNIENYTLDNFSGMCVRYEDPSDIMTGKALLIEEPSLISFDVIDRCVESGVTFLVFNKSLESDHEIALERYSLSHGLISFENVINTDKLPKEFMFFGIPLHIENASGSLVRAFAQI